VYAPRKHFQPGLIFAGKPNVLWTYLQTQDLAGTNNLPYFASSSLKKKKKFCDIVYRGLMKTNRGVKMNYEKLSRAMRYHYGSIKQGRKGHLVSLS
jgi:hypothetical protein